MNKKAFIVIAIIIIIVIFLLGFFRKPQIIKIEKGFNKQLEEKGDIYYYSITTSKNQYNVLVREPKNNLNFNKYNYILIEIDRGAACDADIDITDVVEKNNELIIEYKLSNIASGCMRSTPRYYAIPIDKKIHTNINVKLTEVR